MNPIAVKIRSNLLFFLKSFKKYRLEGFKRKGWLFHCLKALLLCFPQTVIECNEGTTQFKIDSNSFWIRYLDSTKTWLQITNRMLIEEVFQTITTGQHLYWKRINLDEFDGGVYSNQRIIKEK